MKFWLSPRLVTVALLWRKEGKSEAAACSNFMDVPVMALSLTNRPHTSHMRTSKVSDWVFSIPRSFLQEYPRKGRYFDNFLQLGHCFGLDVVGGSKDLVIGI